MVNLTSSALIASVKRLGMIPISDKTFNDNDILSIANDEIATGILPDVLTYFESYFLFREGTPLVASQDSYEIPYRAIGQKLQDVIYKDNTNNMYEMARIQPDERVFFQFTQGSFNNTFRFYVENNAIVLAPGVGPNAAGSLEFNYYLRPNQLVDEDRVASATAITYKSAITCASVNSGDKLYIGSDYTLEAGVDFAATGTNAQVATALGAAITGYTVSVSSNLVTISKTSRFTTDASATTLSSEDTVVLSLNKAPDNITEGSEVDFLQYKPGFKTYDYDYEMPAGSIDSVAKTFTLPTDDLPLSFVKNDYIVSAGECSTPQIPVELHPMLVQRVICRCLEALGDTAGLANAKEKLAEMIAKMGNLIDNRVESAPQKIFNKGSPLRISKHRQRNYFRF